MYTRLLVFLIVAICVVVGLWLVPLLTIWAINVLFDTTIAYNFINWFAMLVLLALFGRGK